MKTRENIYHRNKDIKEMYGAGVEFSQLSELYGLSKRRIQQICKEVRRPSKATRVKEYLDRFPESTVYDLIQRFKISYGYAGALLRKHKKNSSNGGV